MSKKPIAEAAGKVTQSRLPFDEDRLDRVEAAAYIGLSPPTLATDASTHRLGIPFYKIGSRVAYRRSDLDFWIESRRVDPNKGE